MKKPSAKRRTRSEWCFLASKACTDGWLAVARTRRQNKMHSAHSWAMSEFAQARKSSSLSVICKEDVKLQIKLTNTNKKNLPLQGQLISLASGWCLDLPSVINSPILTIDEVALYKIPSDSSVAIPRHLIAICISPNVTMKWRKHRIEEAIVCKAMSILLEPLTF